MKTQEKYFDGFIYGLVDPRFNKIKYIGSTVDIKTRYNQHLFENGNNAKSKWICELKENGLNPILIILENINNMNDLGIREKFWYNFYKKEGLYNTQPPGRQVILNINNQIKKDKTLKEISLLVLANRLKKYNNNITKTAKSLGVSKRWIQLRIKEYKDSIINDMSGI